MFQSQIEHGIFRTCEKPLGYPNLSRNEWKAVHSLADDHSIVIKKAEKGSFVVVWGRNDYVIEAQKQLNDSKVYKNTSYSKDLIRKLAEKSNKIFESLKQVGFISEKQLKYYCFDLRKESNLGKLYLSTKVHKRMFNVPSRPFISS